MGTRSLTQEWAWILLPYDVIVNYTGVAIASAYYTLAVGTAERRLNEALERADWLLKNILPPTIAQRMREGEDHVVEAHPMVGVLPGHRRFHSLEQPA